MIEDLKAIYGKTTATFFTAERRSDPHACPNCDGTIGVGYFTAPTGRVLKKQVRYMGQFIERSLVAYPCPLCNVSEDGPEWNRP